MPPSHDEARRLARLFDWLNGSRGAAALAVGTLIANLLGPVKDISFAKWSSPVAFVVSGIAAMVFWHGGRRLWSAAAVLGLLLSGAAAVRAYSAPSDTEFYYTGAVLTTFPPAPDGGIPLTADPRDGAIAQTIYPDEPEDMRVSCVQAGQLTAAGQTVPMLWARIESGKFQTLWIPTRSLGAFEGGSVRTLLDCSDWRWLLQNYGKK